MRSLSLTPVTVDCSAPLMPHPIMYTSIEHTNCTLPLPLPNPETAAPRIPSRVTPWLNQTILGSIRRLGNGRRRLHAVDDGGEQDRGQAGDDALRGKEVRVSEGPSEGLADPLLGDVVDTVAELVP